METTLLIMYFLDKFNNKISVQIADPKSDLIPEEVKPAMESLIQSKVLVGKEGAELVEVHSAQIVVRTVQALEME